MSICIELYFLSYISLFFLMMLFTKVALKSSAKISGIFVAAVVFAVIKFSMDYFGTLLWAQILVTVFYIVSAGLVIYKFNHITKLLLCLVICSIYYLCIVGINSIITNFAGEQAKNINNYYLLLILGTNLVVFALSNIVKMFFKDKSMFNLLRKCTLVVGNTKINVTGFVDTGNCLKDPKSGQEVVILSLPAIKKQLPNGIYADLLFATNSSGSFEDIHKIKYSTIAGTHFITVFKPKCFLSEGKEINCYVGASLVKNNYEMLLNISCL